MGSEDMSSTTALFTSTHRPSYPIIPSKTTEHRMVFEREREREDMKVVTAIFWQRMAQERRHELLAMIL
jgi:hypothetical protein